MKKLVVDIKEFSQMLCVSTRHMWRMDIEGKIPMAIKLGSRLKRWSVKEIELWVDNGMPPRVLWMKMKEKL